jgi:hypothetical protein
MKRTLKFIFLFVCLNYIYSQNPLTILGIPSLKPSQIFGDDENLQAQNFKKEKVIRHKQENFPNINTIKDLQDYLQISNLDENEGLNLVSRFLISDDFYSKQNGVIFDISGFDGLPMEEKINPLNTVERESQRARSAAKKYVRFFNFIYILLPLLFVYFFVIFFYFLLFYFSSKRCIMMKHMKLLVPNKWKFIIMIGKFIRFYCKVSLH